MRKIGLTVMILFLSALSFSLQESYDDGKNYASSGISLNGMEQHIKEFHRTEDEAASFSTDNDTILAERGSAALNGEFGKLLYDSEAERINAVEAHQINKQNTFYQDSLLLEQNPFTQTGGREIQHKADVVHEVTEHCEEGISFDVDLINQLTYSPPPREKMNTELTINYAEYLKNVGFQNDELATMSTNTRNHQINLQRFKEHVCPHFKPVDAVTGQTYKIDCNRISNFTLVCGVDIRANAS